MSDADQPDPAESRTHDTGSDPFGEVLPERSRDEEAEAWGDPADADDQRLRDDVPPHHG
jgi:hypothetical protein